jgi:hypothetical protein
LNHHPGVTATVSATSSEVPANGLGAPGKVTREARWIMAGENLISPGQPGNAGVFSGGEEPQAAPGTY